MDVKTCCVLYLLLVLSKWKVGVLFRNTVLGLRQLWAMRSPVFPPGCCAVYCIKEPICLEKCCTCLKAVKFDGWQNSPIAPRGPVLVKEAFTTRLHFFALKCFLWPKDYTGQRNRGAERGVICECWFSQMAKGFLHNVLKSWPYGLPKSNNRNIPVVGGSFRPIPHLHTFASLACTSVTPSCWLLNPSSPFGFVSTAEWFSPPLSMGQLHTCTPAPWESPGCSRACLLRADVVQFKQGVLFLSGPQASHTPSQAKDQDRSDSCSTGLGTVTKHFSVTGLWMWCKWTVLSKGRNLNKLSTGRKVRRRSWVWGQNYRYKGNICVQL